MASSEATGPVCDKGQAHQEDEDKKQDTNQGDSDEDNGYEGDDECDSPAAAAEGKEEKDPDKMDTSEMRDMSLADLLLELLAVLGEIVEVTDQLLVQDEE
ncbi:hypothetical protein BD289DRAFT_507159 [Coniella lustricola]|uniref:Uncharacterized protein n=1 Tax=Coniella lustricola TaxID=2025994 RepID=A0A2T3A3R9_9PEZI|nr:hypothetical protein BD289DRAFT_507159 [Coniella lustricola]